MRNVEILPYNTVPAAGLTGLIAHSMLHPEYQQHLQHTVFQQRLKKLACMYAMCDPVQACTEKAGGCLDHPSSRLHTHDCSSFISVTVLTHPQSPSTLQLFAGIHYKA